MADQLTIAERIIAQRDARIAALESSLAASEQSERELVELNRGLQDSLKTTRADAIRECAAVCERWEKCSAESMAIYGAKHCKDAILALLEKP